MKKIYFIFFAVFLAGGALGQQPVSLAVADILHATEAPQLTGYLAGRLDAAYQHRIMEQNIEKLVQPFLTRTETSCWQTEFWGKWFTSAVLAYRYKPSPALKAILDKSVTDLVQTQDADGYIGNYAPGKHLQQWDIWGRKYCMLGLISYYDLTKNKTALDAAGRVADHLIKELDDTKSLIVKMGNHRGMAASSVLEPIALLYTRTGNKKYLDFAEEIVRQWETADGPQLLSNSTVPVRKRFPKPVGSWYGWEQGQKAYEMMSCYEGLLELYRVTGKAAYKDAVVKTWESISQTEINMAGSGSAAECWFGGQQYQALPISHYQETCVTATWIKLNQQLLRLTGEAKYADAIEQTYYNALLGALYADGSDWAKYTPLSGIRLRGGEQCGMGLNCCEASGPRALFTLPLTAVMQSAKGVQVNFFTAGKFIVQSPAGQPLELQQATGYPAEGEVVITIKLLKPEKFILYLRNPVWSQQSSITVNKEPVPVTVASSYITIERNWKNGDTIHLSLDMRGRLHTSGLNNEYFAITRGPLLLARDLRLGTGNPGEALTPAHVTNGIIDLQLNDNLNTSFVVTASASFIKESHAETGPVPVRLLLCDYASAGNTFSDASLFRAWIPKLVDAVVLP